jgi:CBS domain containing-hemolysin-like protein
MDPAHYEISTFYLIATVFLVLLNGFFVAAEFAMVRVRGSQIEIKAKSGSGVAKVARGILHNLDGYLAATQLGITIASLALGVVGEEVATNIVIRAFLAVGITLSRRVYYRQSYFSLYFYHRIAYCVWRACPQIYRHSKIGTYGAGNFFTAQVFLCVFQTFIWVLKRFCQFYFKAFRYQYFRRRRSTS